MNINNIKSYLYNKPLSSSFLKKDGKILYKVNGKIFAILSEDIYPHIILKNEPFLNKSLREKFNFIFPTPYILNKTYWNTIILVDSIDEEVIIKMIDKSYDLSIEKMTKRQKKHYEYSLESIVSY